MSLSDSVRLSSFIPSFLVNNPVYQDRGARTLLFALGAGYFLTKFLSYTTSLLAPLFYRDRDLGQRYGKNSWVFITGASDGIGRAFSLEFARRGFNIILLGRNREKLEEVDKEVQAQHPAVQTRVLVFDLKNAYQEGFIEEMFHDVKDLDISIVVNNAGQVVVGPYYKADINEIRDLVQVNCLAAALVVRVLLPKLMLRKHKSAVISMSSKVATFPRPFQQIYGCTKIFNEYLSRGLKHEHSRIDFIALKPGKVQTKMTDNKKPDMKTITPEEFVAVGLRYLGRVDKTYGHWKHRWHSWVTDVIPKRLRIYWFQRKFPELKEKIYVS